MSQPLDLDALEALANAATPGPWTAEKDPGAWCEECDSPLPDEHAVIFGATRGGVAIIENGDYALADTGLIIAARTAVPALIAKVREFEAHIEKNTQLISEESARICARIDQALAERDAIRGEYQRLRESSAGAIERLTLERDAARKEAEGLRKEAVALRKLSGSRPKTLAKAHHMIDKLKRQLAEAQGNTSYDGTPYDALRAKLEAAEKERNDALEKLSDAREDLDAFRVELDALRKERDAAQGEFARLMLERNEACASLAVMERERDFERGRANEWLTQLHDAVAENKRLAKEFDAAKKEIERLYATATPSDNMRLQSVVTEQNNKKLAVENKRLAERVRKTLELVDLLCVSTSDVAARVWRPEDKDYVQNVVLQIRAALATDESNSSTANAHHPVTAGGEAVAQGACGGMPAINRERDDGRERPAQSNKLGAAVSTWPGSKSESVGPVKTGTDDSTSDRDKGPVVPSTSEPESVAIPVISAAVISPTAAPSKSMCTTPPRPETHSGAELNALRDRSLGGLADENSAGGIVEADEAMIDALMRRRVATSRKWKLVDPALFEAAERVVEAARKIDLGALRDELCSAVLHRQLYALEDALSAFDAVKGEK